MTPEERQRLADQIADANPIHDPWGRNSQDDGAQPVDDPLASLTPDQRAYLDQLHTPPAQEAGYRQALSQMQAPHVDDGSDLMSSMHPSSRVTGRGRPNIQGALARLQPMAAANEPPPGATTEEEFAAQNAAMGVPTPPRPGAPVAAPSPAAMPAPVPPPATPAGAPGPSPALAQAAQSPNPLPGSTPEAQQLAAADEHSPPQSEGGGMPDTPASDPGAPPTPSTPQEAHQQITSLLEDLHTPPQTASQRSQSMTYEEQQQATERMQDRIGAPPAVRGAKQNEADLANREKRLKAARLQDAVFHALGLLTMGVGQMAAGPRGLPNPQLTASMIPGNDAEQNLQSDFAMEDKQHAGEQAAQERSMQSETEDRRRQEGFAENRGNQMRAQEHQSQEGELNRRSALQAAQIRAMTGEEGQLDANARVHEQVQGQNDRQAAHDQALRDIAALRHPARGAGHGGGAQGNQAAIDARVQAAVRAGDMTEQEARDLLTLGGTRALAQDTLHRRTAHETGQARTETAAANVAERQRAVGIENGRVPIMPNAGVYSTNLQLAHGPEGAKAREGISDARVIYDSLTTIERIGRASNPADPTLNAQLAGARSALLASMGQTQHFGVLSDSEKQRILDAIPNPQSASQWVLGTGGEYLRSHVHTAEGRLSAQLRTAGVDDEGINNALRYVRTGAVTAQGTGRVVMVNPQGQRRNVPADRADAARAAGWQDAQ